MATAARDEGSCPGESAAISSCGLLCAGNGRVGEVIYLTFLLRSHTRPGPGTTPQCEVSTTGRTPRQPGTVIVGTAMAKIFRVSARAGMTRVVEPIARGLLRAGVTPNTVTVAGTVGVLVGALGFGARGHLLTGLVIVTLSALTDLLDGTMARMRGGSSRFGAFLDSSMDRVADSAIFGAVAYWLATQNDHWGLVAALICLAAGQVVSYVKARAEGLGMTCNVGLAERPERLITVGVGGLLSGVGVSWGLTAVLWVLAALSVITVAQRIAHVYRQAEQSVQA
jgi:CDP-diacylglycerol--glycerol-3-phosphate 3-phosphatidyltransferase